MTTTLLAWIVAIPVLGGVTGLRSMTPIAVLCWFAYRGNLAVAGTWGGWAGKLVCALVFAVLAVGELVGDKLPMTPNRTAPFPFFARVCFGGLVGALAATGMRGSVIEGGLLGAAAAVGGAFLGFRLRRYLVKERGLPGLGVAFVEDVLAVGLSFLALEMVSGSMW